MDSGSVLALADGLQTTVRPYYAAVPSTHGTLANHAGLGGTEPPLPLEHHGVGHLEADVAEIAVVVAIDAIVVVHRGLRERGGERRGQRVRQRVVQPVGERVREGVAAQPDDDVLLHRHRLMEEVVVETAEEKEQREALERLQK